MLTKITHRFICSRKAAKEYFQKTNNFEKLILCYQRSEDYESLRSCIPLIPEKHPLLKNLGEIFANVGMCSEAVDAYLKVKI